ncbi:molybdopterin cofactor-binding domain-containing protein [Paraburkholderia sp. FT54]|uniref:xanthine dehydrogenase family protein molybdopterin-binding subunit n=1 Tax=Paraburkholderia sp. FT54 TaxID=3074437 RepID=UPI002878112A|nr:molybdopterin cofactor-binding domain-containing protein [Paraburkholderia sp. FT54]WNC94484.1 molybdopterin cofactor-binding domain-containing protein [Paraburkholderia sp. FT54]
MNSRTTFSAEATGVLVSERPQSLRANPCLGAWLRFSSEGYVDVFSGKVEFGQGIVTALAQIVAEELDVGIDQIRMRPANTAASPDEAVTSGSLSIQHSGTALRHACAHARALLLERAARLLQVSTDLVHQLAVKRGEIKAPHGGIASYWAIAGDVQFDVDVDCTITVKAAAAYTVVGAPVSRDDLADKFLAVPRFIQDIELPGMLHGRVLRPGSRAATLLALDDGAARVVSGVVQVIRDGSLVGVLATSQRAAVEAIDKLRQHARWQHSEPLPEQQKLSVWLKQQPVETTVVANRQSAAPDVARTLKMTCDKPFLAHASIGPSCALARFDGERLEVWSHSQGIFNLRADLALSFDMPVSAVVVRHAEGAGCYGHNAADDVAYDAAWLARAAGGQPVRVQWSRADELAWAPYGPAMVIELEADLDAGDRVVGWRHSVWSNGHGTRPGRGNTPALLGAWHLETPFEAPVAINPPLAAGGGAERNAVPFYDFPAWNIVNHRVLSMPLRTSSLRSLGAFANVFALESFVDDLAEATRSEPLEWRLRHLSDPRARAVLQRATLRAGWHERDKQECIGYGMAVARYKNSGAYCAVVARIEAGVQIVVTRLNIAVDVGTVINPDGVANQIEGGALQAVSWTLKEEVRFDRQRVTSDSWETYPILRFTEVPAVEVDIVPSNAPACGAGEASLGPTAAAIGNAVRDALGVRVTSLPLTAERIIAAFGH